MGVGTVDIGGIGSAIVGTLSEGDVALSSLPQGDVLDANEGMRFR